MILLPCVFLGFVCGVWLVVLGRRGRRIDDHPVCSRCGYDLSGRMPDQYRCSECGVVRGPASVRIGNRECRRGLLWSGVLLALPCGLATAVLMIAFTGGVDLLPYTPSRFVLSRAQDGTEADKVKAFAELQRRVALAGNSSIVERALAIQIDPAIRWDSRWGDLVETAERSKAIAPGQWARYLQQSVRFIEGVRCRVAWDEEIFVWVPGYEMRIGSSLEFDVKSQLTLKCGDITATVPSLGSSIRKSDRSFTGSQSSRFPQTLTARIGAGTKPVTMVHTWNVRAVNGFSGTGSGRMETAIQLTVLPKGEPSVQLRKRPDLSDAVAACLALRGPYAQRNASGEEHWMLTICAEHPPMDLAFHAFLVDHQKEYDLGTYVFRAGSADVIGYSSGGDARPLRDIAEGPVDIVLRPSVEAAADTVDVFEIYEGEIRMKGKLARALIGK